VRDLAGNHLRVLTHERKKPNDRKAEENKTCDFEKQKMENPRGSSDERSDATQKTVR